VATKSTKWRPGQSGNPAGRRRGSGKIGELRQAIADRLPGIVAALIERAEQGDVGAAKLLLDRALPPLRPVDSAVSLPLAGESLTERGAAIFAAALAGQLTPGQGQVLLAGLNALASIKTVDELEARLAALESLSDGGGA
jgi:hypothetical protein